MRSGRRERIGRREKIGRVEAVAGRMGANEALKDGDREAIAGASSAVEVDRVRAVIVAVRDRLKLSLKN